MYSTLEHLSLLLFSCKVFEELQGFRRAAGFPSGLAVVLCFEVDCFNAFFARSSFSLS